MPRPEKKFPELFNKNKGYCLTSQIRKKIREEMHMKKVKKCHTVLSGIIIYTIPESIYYNIIGYYIGYILYIE